MSKEDKAMAAAALGDKVAEMQVTDIPSIVSFVGFAHTGKGFVDYPPSVTDQLHNQSVAEMVRQGQGQVVEDDLSNFDFDADRKDTGRLEVPSLFESDWADPAERFEKEVALNREIRSAVQREVSEKISAAQRAAVDLKISAETAKQSSSVPVPQGGASE